MVGARNLFFIIVFFRAPPFARDSRSALVSRLPLLAWKTPKNNACATGYSLAVDKLLLALLVNE